MPVQTTPIRLLIDTSDNPVRLALVVDAPPRVLDSRQLPPTPDLGRQLLMRISALLSDHKRTPSQLEGIIVHPGPSRSTSALRAGVTAATMLAEAWGIALYALPESSRHGKIPTAWTPINVVKPRYKHQNDKNT